MNCPDFLSWLDKYCCKSNSEPQRNVFHLSIGQHSGVVALQRALDELLDAVIVNLQLVGGHVEDIVVGEATVRAECDLRLPGRDGGTHPTHLDHLARNLGANSATKKESKVETIHNGKTKVELTRILRLTL